MKKLIGFAVLALSFPIAYWLGLVEGASPEPLYEAPADDANLLQWRRNWREADDSVVEAFVVSERPDELLVFVDFIYSGDHGKTATTCGGVSFKGISGRWSCSPTGVRRGRGFATLRFQLASDARAIECSDAIEINFYDRSGHVFFTRELPFDKTWVRDGGGLPAELRQLTASCPESA